MNDNPTSREIELLVKVYDNVASRLTETLLLTGQILQGQNDSVKRHTNSMDKLADEMRTLASKIENTERAIEEKQTEFRGNCKEEHGKISTTVKLAWIGFGTVIAAVVGGSIKVISLLDEIEKINQVFNLLSKMSGGG